MEKRKKEGREGIARRERGREGEKEGRVKDFHYHLCPGISLLSLNIANILDWPWIFF